MEDMQIRKEGPIQLPRACEGCRVRKIRCERTLPCSNCQHLRIACVPANSRHENRPRINVSSHYEKQVELIQERLRGIQSKLDQLAASVVPAKMQEDVSLSSRGPAYQSLRDDTAQAIQLASGFDGDSSFTSNALLAEKVAEHNTTGTSQTPEEDEMFTALRSLKRTLEEHRPIISANHAHFPGFRPVNLTHNLDLPPVAFAVAIVSRSKLCPTDTFLLSAWRDRNLLETLCQRIYFPSERVSLGSLTLMHGLLWEQGQYLSTEHDSQFSYPDMSHWIDVCEKNFYLGIESYEVLTSQSLENAQALALGSMRALGLGRPFLCRTLLAAAANICVSLGYHRRSTLLGDRSLLAESKRHVFWIVYMMDKNVSLSLGRASSLQDYDIDAELFTPSSDSRFRFYDLLCHSAINFARLEGKVYDLVYSARALTAPFEETLEHTARLVQELNNWKTDELEVIIQGRSDCPEGFKPFAIASYPIYYSVLALLHRGRPNSSRETNTLINSACLEAARQSVTYHLKTIPQFINNPSKRSTYVTWSLLYSSFTPFFVVFSNVVLTRNQEDFTLLKSMVNSLETLVSVSEGSKRLHSVCQAFYRAAEVFLQSKQQSKHNYQDSAADQRQLVDRGYMNTTSDMEADAGVIDHVLNNMDFGGYGACLTDMEWHQSMIDLLNSDMLGLRENGDL
ncbi:hypothetical protein BDW69DRAFT_175501 [Aspergillus filifer]